MGVYYGKDNLVDLARLLNEPETKELSKIEQAVSDAVLLANAKKKGRDVLAKLNEDVSNILSPKNSQFLQLFTEICVGDEAKVRAESGAYTHDFQESRMRCLCMSSTMTIELKACYLLIEKRRHELNTSMG